MARRRTELDFPSVRIEGALFPGDFLARIAHFGAPEQSDSDYRIPKKLRLRDELGRYFRIAEGLWQDFQSAPTGKGRDARKITVEAFLLPYLRQVLGFDDVVPVGTMERDGRRFPIGHAATGGRVPLILAARDEDLDEPTERYGDDHRRRSPFLLAQEYLNAGAALWAIVSNGKVLRVLRDNPSLTRPAYLEFDLERLFEERLYPDFAVLWLACHASRFGAASAAASDSALERWKSAAQQEGTRARERLRFGVADALRELGTGFLFVPGNKLLRQRIEQGTLTSEAFYHQLLRLIYRLLFLFTVEERGHIHPEGAAADAVELYRNGYSLAHLRALASKRRRFDRHLDLWQALTITFSGLQKGEPALGLPPLGGLFRSTECPDLDSADLPNAALLQAIYNLAFFVEDGALVRVNYRDMGPEELGSIYEALLELVPEINTASHPWRFGFVGDNAPAGDTVAGNTRKLTGSYYTPDSLVQELVKSALEPVIAERLKNVEDPARALLDIKVLDPACGSGHFLLAAARKLAEHLARARTAGGEPRPSDYRRALREVVSHCIFGVDRNPLALELARTALWLESFSPERPLGFLDHHLRCGDALIGILNPKIMADGIPEEAFKPLSGDEKEAARELGRKNSAARKVLVKERERLAVMQELAIYEAEGGRVLDLMPEDNVDQVEAKREAFERAHRAAEASKAQRLADCFVAAFFVSKTADTKIVTPTTEDFHRILRDVASRAGVSEVIEAATRKAQAFQWHLEFADVMRTGGFDVLLGNPPWERIKLQEEEFFATRSTAIANARNKADRARLIALLASGDPVDRALHESFVAAKRTAEAASVFAHDSGRFPLTGVGDVNTYALFAESFAQLVALKGRAGFIVPTGIATDDTTKAYFEALATSGRLVSLLSFENEEFIFPSVHHAFRFCLLTVGGEGFNERAALVFFARQPEQVLDERRRFSLSANEFHLLNPNTRTCPVFRSQRDAELTKKIYRLAPSLIEDAHDGKAEWNPWGIRFLRMFDMANDSALFMREPAEQRLPLYEAKMAHQFDHRWATYEAGGEEIRDAHESEKRNVHFAVRPRYWVEERQVLARIAVVPRIVAKAFSSGNARAMRTQLANWIAAQWLSEGEKAERIASRLNDAAPCLRPISEDMHGWASAKAEAEGFPLELADFQILRMFDVAQASLELFRRRSPRWLFGWRDITGVEKIRTLIAALLPRAAVGDKFLLFFPNQEPRATLALLGCMNSIPCDFVARQKVGGTSLKYFTMKQMSILAPHQLSARDLDFVVPRVLELTYCATDVKPIADAIGYSGPPFVFNNDRRALLRAELDAYFAVLYGLSRDELRYILDPRDVMGSDYPSETFRVLRKSEEREFGEYRTRRLVLQAWDRLEHGDFAAAPRVPRSAVAPTQSADLLEAGAWARPMSDEHVESGAMLGAILKAMTDPMPSRQVRLAATLALQPRFLKPYLTAAEASMWQRLIGPEADVLPQGTSVVIPRADRAWGAAVRTLRTNGYLVEETRSAMWAPGSNLDALQTVGWPDGRARFVLTVLERQATEVIVRELPESFRDWIDAQAA